ncbi:hypothetical protein GZH46_02690 [Fragariocoptes setiger]|uniref:Uncharacterized protein n=1 Tax=Fragariocoptes setiger TaxID=1670756 RepID=A0ABQ7S5X0_9ACAR|nr:hypothetical protein GZH46_02690 [Fragariocoptes setiger]
MFKVSLILALALVACVNAAHDVTKRQAPGEGPAPEGRAEPYAYQYETDSSTAAQSGDPNGRVTGFYTVADADGRQRRVDYIADEAGFRAKVQTNEVGTASQSPADVEMVASPPNPEQYTSYQTATTGVVQAPPAVTTVSQAAVAAPRPAVQSSTFQRQVDYNYGVNQPGYGGYYGYYSQPGYGYNTASYGAAYNAPGYSYGPDYGYGYGNGYGYGSGYYGASSYGTGPSYGVQRYTVRTTSSTSPAAVTYSSGGIRGVQTASGSSSGVTRYATSGPISGSSYTQSYGIPGGYYQSGPLPINKA